MTGYHLLIVNCYWKPSAIYYVKQKYCYLKLSMTLSKMIQCDCDLLFLYMLPILLTCDNICIFVTKPTINQC